ncbi:MAG: cysteine-rich CWC family protein [Cyclobacteriaceae bacterium]|nr:cysteine-rich CWC family protein [Cyclobacteriaceae bacterium]
MCNNHNIIKCGCMEVPLNNTAREIISEQYDGCLCVSCLEEINNQSCRT